VASADAVTVARRDVLPVLDQLLAVTDRAVSACDGYIASGIALDESTRSALEKIRRRDLAMHRVRDAIAKLRDPISNDMRIQVQTELESQGPVLFD
jgi:hypothetical protein